MVYLKGLKVGVNIFCDLLAPSVQVAWKVPATSHIGVRIC